MISQQDLRRLAGVRSEAGVLSAYIKIDPRPKDGSDQAVSRFKGSLSRFLRTADPIQTEVARREQERVLAYLENAHPTGRGLAIFSCEPSSIWETISMDVTVPTIVKVDTTTNTGILARVVNEHPRFALAVVQRDRGTIYTSEQRDAVREAEIESDVPGQHDQGGWSQARFQRHIEVHVERHLAKLIDELKGLYHADPFNRLVIGGTQETVAELTGMLSEPLAGLVIGSFGVDFKHEGEPEVLEKARTVVRDFERLQEQQIVSRLTDAADAGGKGVVGVAETILAVQDGRVDTLVVADGIAREGIACEQCDYFEAGHSSRCERCGASTATIPDVIDRAIEAAFFTDGRVEVVFGEAREWLLARDGIGALLRY